MCAHHSLMVFHSQVAEIRLRDAGLADGLFLVRDSAGGSVVVSLAYHGRVMHYKFETTSDGKYASARGREFADIETIIYEYQADRADMACSPTIPCPVPTSHADDDEA